MNRYFSLAMISLAIFAVSCSSSRNAEKNHENKKMFSFKGKKKTTTPQKDHFANNKRGPEGGSDLVSLTGRRGKKSGRSKDAFASSRKGGAYNTNGDGFSSKSTKGRYHTNGDGFGGGGRRGKRKNNVAGDSFSSAQKKNSGPSSDEAISGEKGKREKKWWHRFQLKRSKEPPTDNSAVSGDAFASGGKSHKSMGEKGKQEKKEKRWYWPFPIERRSKEERAQEKKMEEENKRVFTSSRKSARKEKRERARKARNPEMGLWGKEMKRR